MNIALLRRVRYPRLDRKVARGTHQICHQSVMQRVYISRVDVQKQWIVIANPTDGSVDLSGYIITSTDGRQTFRFPRKYTLLSGDEVTVWCAPGWIALDTDNLLQPYLFWTTENGALRDTPFFTSSSSEAILLDSFMIEIASVRIDSNGNLSFRVRHSRSIRGMFIQAMHEIPRCLGLRMKNFKVQSAHTHLRWRILARRVYIFSRYWNIRSDLSLWKHLSCTFLAPILETLRLLSIRNVWILVHDSERHSSGQLVFSLVLYALVILWVDWAARCLCLFIKSGILVSLLSFTSVLLDHIVNWGLFSSLARLYPQHATQLTRLWRLDIGISFLNLIASQVDVIRYRTKWPPTLVFISRWDYRLDGFICANGIGRVLLSFVLLLLPFDPTSDHFRWIGFSLIPSYTLALLVDFIRGVPGLIWWTQTRLLRKGS
uniref:Uncharacterized protein AlNc14C309G10480 n=1 Tax=Albugo laibachii Nc14 TaxID=890382 RepID=F0WW32_9STRA|nr:conserved hypothetical protein [Albugo laibachii Nc14]|eukprot:CCA25639.1 conserved hypothetical protein [Albugo laibachii Nc14]